MFYKHTHTPTHTDTLLGRCSLWWLSQSSPGKTTRAPTHTHTLIFWLWPAGLHSWLITGSVNYCGRFRKHLTSCQTPHWATGRPAATHQIRLRDLKEGGGWGHRAPVEKGKALLMEREDLSLSICPLVWQRWEFLSQQNKRRANKPTFY